MPLMLPPLAGSSPPMTTDRRQAIFFISDTPPPPLSIRARAADAESRFEPACSVSLVGTMAASVRRIAETAERHALHPFTLPLTAPSPRLFIFPPLPILWSLWRRLSQIWGLPSGARQGELPASRVHGRSLT